MKKLVSKILIITMLCFMTASFCEAIFGTDTVFATVVNPDGVDKSDTDETAADDGSGEADETSKAGEVLDGTGGVATPATTENEGIMLAASKTPPTDCVIPENADFTYEDILYKPATAYDPEREPMNAAKMEVTYKGTKYPAYYWAPGDMVVLLVGLADTDVTPWEELSQSDQDTWKSWMSDKYETPEEAYYADALPTYTFYFDFKQNKIRPFVEFQYGPDGKVVMTDFIEDQEYFLDSLSPSFLKLGNFEFDVYQFLTVNDDTCYYIFSGLDQLGNCYLYQYDANGNCCSRADMNLLVAVKYLEERTIALNEYVDKVQHYQDVVRKIIAGIIFAVVIAVIVCLNLFLRRRMSDSEDEEEVEEEDEEDEELSDDDESFVSFDESKEESSNTEAADPEAEYFYAADTEQMRAMFRTVPEEEIDEDDEDEDDIEDIEIDVAELGLSSEIEVELEEEEIEDELPKEEIKKEKIKKEKVKKEKPAKKVKPSKHAKTEFEKDDDVLDLNDL